MYNFKFDSAINSGDPFPRTSRFRSIALHFGYAVKEVPMGYVNPLEHVPSISYDSIKSHPWHDPAVSQGQTLAPITCNKKRDGQSQVGTHGKLLFAEPPSLLVSYQDINSRHALPSPAAS